MELQPLKSSKFENNQMDKQNMARVESVKKNIYQVQQKLKNQETPDILRLMDLIEELIGACGGEQKAQFMEVSRNFIRIHTRVSMEANIFPFMPEVEGNDRMHKVVTKMLLLCPTVEGVRWVPEERGSTILIMMNK